jgi:hypothetical protein
MIYNYFRKLIAIIKRKYNRYKYREFYKFSKGEQEWHNSAKHKTLMPSIEACNDFLKGSQFTIKLAYININTKEEQTGDFQIELINDNNPGLHFKITNPELFTVGAVKYKESYGLNKSLVISNSQNIKLYVREESVKDFDTIFPLTPQVLTGTFTNISTVEYSKLKDSYFRLIIRVHDTEICFPTAILEAKNFLKFDVTNWDRQRSLMGLPFMSIKGQYCEIELDNIKYDFYIVEQNRCFFIDSIQKVDIDTFKAHSNAIRSYLALLSGKYYRTEARYVTSADENFEKIEDVYYEVENATVLTNLQLIDPNLFFETFQVRSEEYKIANRKYHKRLSAEIFQNLCQQIIDNKTLSRTVELIIAGNENLEPVQQGAIYSVAIEALANEIYDINKKKLNPIKSSGLSKTIKDELLAVLNKYTGQLSNEDFQVIKTKIEMLNQPTNRLRLLLPFELYGIKLTESEAKSLNHRNDFLHGRSPNDDINVTKKVALTFHHLIGCLLLKHIGYEGYITNLANKIFHKRNEDFLFKEIEQIELIYFSATDPNVTKEVQAQRILEMGVKIKEVQIKIEAFLKDFDYIRII